MPGMMLLGTVVGLVFLAVVGLTLWAVVRRAWPAPRDAALAILRERYARGEISREEFEARRRDLNA